MKTSEISTIALEDVLDVVDIAVATISRRLPAFVSRDDLASIGKIALVTSLNRCEGSVDEVRAACYVRVRSAILDEVRRMDPESRRNRETIRSVLREIAAYEAINGRAPHAGEIARKLSVPLKSVRRALDSIAAAENHEAVAWDSLPDENAVSPSLEAEAGELRSVLISMLSTLTIGQATAVRGYFLDDLTLEEIGNEIGVSTERARQLRERGVEKLRAQFAALGLWQILISRKA